MAILYICVNNGKHFECIHVYIHCKHKPITIMTAVGLHFCVFKKLNKINVGKQASKGGGL